MWKYVSRRVKDTLEKTQNILDVGRTRFCSSSGLCDGQQQQIHPESDSKKDVLLYKKRGCYMSRFVARNRCSSRNQRQQDEEKAGQERQRERLNHQQSWLGAITWSSAIVCGWYTSQYICLRRKRMGWTLAGPGGVVAEDGNGNKCVYASILMNTTRTLHTNVSSRIAYAAPPYPPGSSSSYVPPSALGALLQNVNHPHDDETSSKASESLTLDSGITKSSHSERSSASLEDAVAEFSTAIGEIEYQFGVQDLMAKDYRSAVNHLRMATTHHHSGATFNLGLCYERGLGVDRDLERAVECYQVASSMGHPKAMYNLGVFYVRGWGGLKRSRKAALECFDVAARLGQKDAKVAMQRHHERQQQQEQTRLEPKLISAWANEIGFGVKAF